MRPPRMMRPNEQDRRMIHTDPDERRDQEENEHGRCAAVQQRAGAWAVISVEIKDRGAIRYWLRGATCLHGGSSFPNDRGDPVRYSDGAEARDREKTVRSRYAAAIREDQFHLASVGAAKVGRIGEQRHPVQFEQTLHDAPPSSR